MIKRLFLVFLSTLMLSSCNSNQKQSSKKQPTSWEDIEAEESVLQARIDSGYFYKEYHNKNKPSEVMGKAKIFVFIKHEYSVSDKIFTIEDFPELNISWFSYNYSFLEENDTYRLQININLLEYSVNSITTTTSIVNLVNNKFVYDVTFQALEWGFYE